MLGVSYFRLTIIFCWTTLNPGRVGKGNCDSIHKSEAHWNHWIASGKQPPTFNCVPIVLIIFSWLVALTKHRTVSDIIVVLATTELGTSFARPHLVRVLCHHNHKYGKKLGKKHVRGLKLLFMTYTNIYVFVNTSKWHQHPSYQNYNITFNIFFCKFS